MVYQYHVHVAPSLPPHKATDVCNDKMKLVFPRPFDAHDFHPHLRALPISRARSLEESAHRRQVLIRADIRWLSATEVAFYNVERPATVNKTVSSVVKGSHVHGKKKEAPVMMMMVIIILILSNEISIYINILYIYIYIYIYIIYIYIALGGDRGNDECLWS